jgi:hypothetical protein
MKNLLFTAFAMLFFAHPCRAQNYSINWFKVSGGGGTATGGVYALNGTLGQPDAGAMSGGGYSLVGGFWSVTVPVQQPGAPLLAILRSGPNAILSWSASATGYTLESTGNLSIPNGWSVVSPAPTSTNGFNYVTNPIIPGKTFYRLNHP